MRIVLAIFSLLLMLPIVGSGKVLEDETSDKVAQAIPSSLASSEGIFRSFPQGLENARKEGHDLILVLLSSSYSHVGLEFLINLAESFKSSLVGDVATIVLLSPSASVDSNSTEISDSSDSMAESVLEFKNFFPENNFPQICLVTIEVTDHGNGSIIDISSLEECGVLFPSYHEQEDAYLENQ